MNTSSVCLCVCLSQVKVLYGGTELFDDEVRRTFHSDMLLALISGGCITALVYILTSFSGTAAYVSIKQNPLTEATVQLSHSALRNNPTQPCHTDPSLRNSPIAHQPYF